MAKESADVLICGAGIAGISSAYHLATQYNPGRILLVDERSPMSLTSDKSTECYRNWWPGPGSAMVDLMNHSIDLLEDWADRSGNVFNLNRRGYLFATADPDQANTYRQLGQEISSLGAGPLRVHSADTVQPEYQPTDADGYHDQPIGADLFLNQNLIREHFPYLSHQTVAVLQARRAGWFSAQQLGEFLFKEASAAGVEFASGRMEGVTATGGQVQSVQLATESGPVEVETQRLVLAAGPELNSTAGMMGVNLPIFSELHAKVSFADTAGAIPRDAGLLIWSDPVELPWTDEEASVLANDPQTTWLLEPLPAGVHGRPDGPADSPIVLLLWTYDVEPVTPVFPPEFDTLLYPEVAIRGFARMVPALETYFHKVPRPFVDGGYYTKTRENRPLIGPLPVEGAYVIGALSGYGLMAAPAAGGLLAAHVMGAALPEYESWFRLERYEDPEYQRLLESWGSSGQL